MARDQNTKAEFGDFQTPTALAREVCALIGATGFAPACIIEPTCGRGAFLQAAIEAFPGAKQILGLEQNSAYVQQAQRATRDSRPGQHVQILHGDYFETDWPRLVAGLPGPILVLGNPPWVTSAAVGSMGGGNLPTKTNADNLRGIDALTGKSNFDISEWMIRRNIEWLADAPGMLAVLCKTAVARKILSHAWSQGLPLASAAVRRIDSRLHFGASVDACLLILRFEPGAASADCGDYGSLRSEGADAVFGYRDGRLVADVRLHDRWRHLLGHGLSGWRSGIKHDCSDVFELVSNGEAYTNGAGVRVEIESEVLFPLLKSSDLARKRSPRKWLLATQRTMSATPEDLQYSAPNAWRYLLANEARLARRGSSIYRNRPRFSIFGVGEYSFAPWKVAISGLYKKLEFVAVPPYQGRPVVLDDTCYFFPCDSERECELLLELVRSEPAREFWSAFLFWDAKRPITSQTLNLLDFSALARALNVESDVVGVLSQRQQGRRTNGTHQPLLFSGDDPETAGEDLGPGLDAHAAPPRPPVGRASRQR